MTKRQLFALLSLAPQLLVLALASGCSERPETAPDLTVEH